MMTEALIPPDRFASGLYWLQVEGMKMACHWEAASGLWSGLWGGGFVSPDDAWSRGYTFATDPPHRIPTAEELRAVYAVIGAMDVVADGWRMAGANAAADHYGFVVKQLRAALGITPAQDPTAKEQAR